MVSARVLRKRVGLRFAPAFGHGFGKVGEQDREPQPERDLEVEPERAWMSIHSRNSRDVVATLPTSTTNMTGFFIMLRGFSFTNESSVARRTIFRSQIDFVLNACLP